MAPMDITAPPAPGRDARAEAAARLGGSHLALVLEPSPPAVGEPWFADDPVDPGPLGVSLRAVARVPLLPALARDGVGVELDLHVVGGAPSHD